jgi:hypothetical protein
MLLQQQIAEVVDAQAQRFSNNKLGWPREVLPDDSFSKAGKKINAVPLHEFLAG